MGELYQLPEGCEKGLINQALCKFTLNERILPIVFLAYMKQTIGNLETKGSGIQNIAAVSCKSNAYQFAANGRSRTICCLR